MVVESGWTKSVAVQSRGGVASLQPDHAALGRDLKLRMPAHRLVSLAHLLATCAIRKSVADRRLRGFALGSLSALAFD